MTGTSGTHDGNGCRLNIHIGHSLCVFYDCGFSRLSGVDGRTWCQPRVWSKSRIIKRRTGREEVGKMTHQPTVTKKYKNTQSKFDSYPWTCDVSVASRFVRLSTSSGTQLLLLPEGNSDVPLFFSFLKLPPLRMQAFQELQPGSTVLQWLLWLLQ